jgi:Trk-type K+ transport system membrane component
MKSLAVMEFALIISAILSPLILINVVVYIVKKEILKTTLRRSLKVFIAALITITLSGFLINLYNSKQPKQDSLIFEAPLKN